MRPVRPVCPVRPMRPMCPMEQMPQTLQMQHMLHLPQPPQMQHMQHLPQPLQTLRMRHGFDLALHTYHAHHHHETLTFQRLWPAGSLRCLNTVELSPHHSVLQRPSTPYSAIQCPSKLPVDNMKRPPRPAKTWIRLHVKVHLAHLSVPDDV